MLQEVELVVAGACPEIVADLGQRLFALVAFFVDHRYARLLPERWIGQHHFVSHPRLFRQAVYAAVNRAFIAANTVQVEIHYAQACDAVHQFVARECLQLQVPLLVSVEFVVLANVVVRDQQEPAGIASWVVDGLPGSGRITSTIAWINGSRLKYCPAPPFTSAAFFSSRPA